MNNNQPKPKPRAAVLYLLPALFALISALPFAPQARAEVGEAAGKIVNPGTELWREARDAKQGQHAGRGCRFRCADH